ncbi:MAG: cation:proton antiporter, partial [Pyrinomonadaceae bacterium]
MKKLWIILTFAIGTLFFAPAASAATSDGGHGGIVTSLLGIAIILILAKLAGELCVRLGQAPVLGELLVGIILGSLALTGFAGLDFLKTDAVIESLAQLGILILLFEVGLETDIREMRETGLSAMIVAAIGIVLPLILGYATAEYFMPEMSFWGKLFIGATLSATSIGITARVLKDLGKIDSKEAKIILGGAVIDDIGGLLMMSVIISAISSLTTSAELSALSILMIFVEATAFLLGAFLLGRFAFPLIARAIGQFQVKGGMLVFSLALCFLMAWLSAAVGLAPIVGAFAAGLILEEAHFDPLPADGIDDLIELIAPLTAIFAPIFFVSVGLKVDVTAFTNPHMLGFTVALLAAAILGKLACSLGVVGKGMNRLAIGRGLVPRGEVPLIFASLGMMLML